MDIIKHRLDLLLRLIDTTTGRPITDPSIQCYRNNELFHMADKGGGIRYSVDLGRENFDLRINIYGYEEKKLFIDYEKLDEKEPRIDLFFLPKRNALSLEGKLQGITEIQAVSEGTSSCFVSSYDARKKVLQLFNPHAVKIDKPFYGIVHPDEAEFDIFSPIEEDGLTTIPIKEPLTMEARINDPIQRVIFGETFEDGSYRIRVADNGSKQRHLVRFVVNGEVYFQWVDFLDLKGVQLECAEKIKHPSAEETEVDAEE